MFSFFKEPKMMFYFFKKKNLDKASFRSPVLCFLCRNGLLCPTQGKRRQGLRRLIFKSRSHTRQSLLRIN